MRQRRNFRLTKPLSVINLFKLRPSNLTAADANTANVGTDTDDSETVRASVRRPPFASLSPCLLSRSRLRAESSVGTHTAHRHLPSLPLPLPPPPSLPSVRAPRPQTPLERLCLAPESHLSVHPVAVGPSVHRTSHGTLSPLLALAPSS